MWKINDLWLAIQADALRKSDALINEKSSFFFINEYNKYNKIITFLFRMCHIIMRLHDKVKGGICLEQGIFRLFIL